MVEPEMTFTDLEEITTLAEKLVKYVVNYVLTNNYSELEYLEKHNQKELVNKLKGLVNRDFVKVNYSECIKILAIEKKENFVFNDIK
jgi:asparaginyl-tRNA synthetase